MVYSDVQRKGYFQSINKKSKYNITDVRKLLQNNIEITLSQAVFIIKCVAIFNNAEISNTLFNFNSNKTEI